MIYWISYKKIVNGKWKYCEEQFYPENELKLIKSLKKHYRDGWRVNNFEIYDQGSGYENI